TSSSWPLSCDTPSKLWAAPSHGADLLHPVLHLVRQTLNNRLSGFHPVRAVVERMELGSELLELNLVLLEVVLRVLGEFLPHFSSNLLDDGAQVVCVPREGLVPEDEVIVREHVARIRNVRIHLVERVVKEQVQRILLGIQHA